MVGTVTSIYRGEESPPTQGSCASYRGHPARARGGQNNRSFALPAEYFCARVRVRATETFSGTHWAVRCRATAFRSPCHRFCLERRRSIRVCSTYCGERRELDRAAPWLLRIPSPGT